MHTHLTRVHLKGYRNIQDTETTFREGLNIIIGPNGCGKTNFLWLLANIDREETNSLSISGNIEGIKGYIENNRIFNTINIHHKQIDNNSTVKIVSNTGKFDFDAEFDFSFNYSRLFLSFNIPTEIECFSSAVTLTCRCYGNAPRMNTKNMVIHHLFYHKNRYPLIEPLELNFEQHTIDILKKYTPIQDIRVESPQYRNEIKKLSETEISISNLMYGFKTNNEWFKWNELSDGTRRIAWIVLNIFLINSSIILIDAPEFGIHPHQLRLLMEFIKDESENKQIIITTHSPEVLDVLESHELDRIKIARYDEVRGTTVIEGLSEKKMALIQKYIKNTSLLSNYWSNIGLENTKKSF